MIHFDQPKYLVLGLGITIVSSVSVLKCALTVQINASFVFTVTFLRNLLPDPCHKMKVSHTKNTAFMKALRELRILLNVEILT